MPAQKNQHYVPRCALRPFSLNAEGLAINLFNISRRRAIANAPVKGQCARDYLYGKEDLRAEQLLAKLEGQYSRILDQLTVGGPLPKNDKELLQLFMLIQFRRTEMAIQQMRNWGESMEEAIFRRAPDQRPQRKRTDADLMRLSLKIGIELLEYVKDLKVVIFRNETNTDFVTCDNPAILTNRFHFQRLATNQFGVSNSGALIVMPLSPRLTSICYDGAVYSIPNASGTPYVEIKRATDAAAVNELQYLAASKNIYFRRWEDRSSVASEAAKVSQKRTGAIPKSTIFIKDTESPHADSYRTGTPEEEVTARESLVATAFQYPEPSTWPSQLRFRDKPKTFSNGSAAGHMRKPEWLIPERKRRRIRQQA
jgi:hypothetical protein